MAFIGGLAAVGIVYQVASLVRRHDSVLVLVLAGVAVSALLGAGISLIKILSDPYAQLSSITFWLLGGLNAVTSSELAATAPAMLAGLVPMALLRWRMNLLSLADEEASALGIDVAPPAPGPGHRRHAEHGGHSLAGRHRRLDRAGGAARRAFAGGSRFLATTAGLADARCRFSGRFSGTSAGVT